MCVCLLRACVRVAVPLCHVCAYFYMSTAMATSPYDIMTPLLLSTHIFMPQYVCLVSHQVSVIDQYNRSCCHGNVHLNQDSQPLRVTSNAWRVAVNPVDVYTRRAEWV